MISDNCSLEKLINRNIGAKAYELSNFLLNLPETDRDFSVIDGIMELLICLCYATIYMMQSAKNRTTYNSSMVLNRSVYGRILFD